MIIENTADEYIYLFDLFHFLRHWSGMLFFVRRRLSGSGAGTGGQLIDKERTLHWGCIRRGKESVYIFEKLLGKKDFEQHNGERGMERQ